MSQSKESPSASEMVELMRADPDEVLRENTDRLRDMQEATDSPELAAFIDVLLDEYEESGGGYE